MRILITSPRAPVSLEWIKIAQRSRHDVLLVDSLDYPIAKFYKNTRYIKVPSPVLDFRAYQEEMLLLLAQVDMVIPTCEDIFYLSHVRDQCPHDVIFLMPKSKLLFQLHHKIDFFECMNTYVENPISQLITCKEQIVCKEKSLLKPVFSRFGRDVIREVTPKSIENIKISTIHPWVQQQFISGHALCNYAICEHGQVIAHIVYRPKYLFNQAAATYFEYTQDARCNDFIQQFAKENDYHGQVAFDFIDDGQKLYVLECNPRATSGLHLLAETLEITKDGNLIQKRMPKKRSYRIGWTLYLFFGFQALCKGQLKQLHYDHQRAHDVTQGLAFYAPLFALYEMIKRMIYFWKPLSSVSTFDIEYNGDKKRL